MVTEGVFKVVASRLALKGGKVPSVTKRDEGHLERTEKELDSPKLRRQGSGKEDGSEAVHHRVTARGLVARVGGTMGNTVRLHFHVNLLTSHKECAMYTLTRSHKSCRDGRLISVNLGAPSTLEGIKDRQHQY